MQQMSERPPAARPSRRRPPRMRASTTRTVSLEELDHLLDAHERAVRARLDEGLRALYRGTVKLMRQVAEEAWRAGGPTADQHLKDRIVGALARDGALRALLHQADERHQELRLRVERIERAIRHLITANRSALERANGHGPEAEGAAPALLARVDALGAEVARAGEHHRRELATFTGRLAEALARASQKMAEDVVRQLEAGPQGTGRRQEERLERRLDELRASVDGLARAWDRPPTHAPRGRAGSATRLRALERRLARISGEMAGLSAPRPAGDDG